MTFFCDNLLEKRHLTVVVHLEPLFYCIRECRVYEQIVKDMVHAVHNDGITSKLIFLRIADFSSDSVFLTLSCLRVYYLFAEAVFLIIIILESISVNGIYVFVINIHKTEALTRREFPYPHDRASRSLLISIPLHKMLIYVL